MGGATCDLTLVDSSDDDAPFVVSAAPARPSRRLVLVPESVDATPQSIQDREWVEPTVGPVRSVVAPEVFPITDDADVEVATSASQAAVGDALEEDLGRAGSRVGDRVPETFLDSLAEDLERGGHYQSHQVSDATQWESGAQFSSQFQSQSERQPAEVVDTTIGDLDEEQRDPHRDSAVVTKPSVLPTPTVVPSPLVQETPDAGPFAEATTESWCSGVSDEASDAEDEFADVPLSEVEIPVVEFTITREF